MKKMGGVNMYVADIVRCRLIQASRINLEGGFTR
jgi:hypothetical protein